MEELFNGGFRLEIDLDNFNEVLLFLDEMQLTYEQWRDSDKLERADIFLRIRRQVESQIKKYESK